MYLYILLCTFASSVVAFAPDKIHAEANAYTIFNSVHSAGRQWGSALYHNGFALIPGVVPRGSIFYHAASTTEQPTEGPARLAFEPEGADTYSSNRINHDRSPSDGPGFMHTYRNRRDLKVLLADGLSAAQSDKGTLDTQDFLLLEGNDRFDKDSDADDVRSRALCETVQPWGYDGLIRAGLGFELLLCNVTGTVWQMKTKRALSRDQSRGDDEMRVYQWARAASQRYDGLGARLKLDFSSMVSALFYPVNSTNPDPSHPELARLAATPAADLRAIKDRVGEIARAKFQTFLIDWRYIVDTIITRFSDRLAAMADNSVGGAEFVNEVEAAAISYIDAATLETDSRGALEQAVKDCMDHYLYPALPFSGRWNEADHMLYHTVITVTSDICTTLIYGWSHLGHGSDAVALDRVKSTVQQLTGRLGWTPWRRTRPCPIDETVFIAMWPYGNEQDHIHPGCRSRSQLVGGKTGYWNATSFDATASLLSEEL